MAFTLEELLAAKERKRASQGLPTSIPAQFGDSSLVPTLSKNPDRQLEEFRVRSAAKQLGVDPHVAAAVAYQESGFNPEAVSPTGVRGTMQVTQNTANSMGFNRDIPDQNILAGVTYLKGGLDRYPDPNDLHKWKPSVENLAQKSRELQPRFTLQELEAAKERKNKLKLSNQTQGAGESYKDPGEELGMLPGRYHALRKFIQSATIGGSEPLAAAVSAGIENLFPNKAQKIQNKGKKFTDLYSDIRAQQKQSLAQGAEANPGMDALGNVLGFVVPGSGFNLLSKNVSKVASKVPKLASKTGEGLNFLGRTIAGGSDIAAYQALHPDEDISPGMVALGAAVPSLGIALEGAGKGIQKLGRKNLNKTLGTSSKQIEKGQNLADDLMARNVPVKTEEGLKKHALSEVEKNENKLQEALSKSDEVADQGIILKELDNAKKDFESLEESVRPTFLKKIDELKKEITENPQNVALKLSELNKKKRSLYKKVGEKGYYKDTDSAQQVVDKAYARGMRKAIESKIPEAASINQELKVWGSIAKNIAKKASKSETASIGTGLMNMGRRDLGPAGLGLLLGGPSGAGAAVAASELAGTMPGAILFAKGTNAAGKGLEGAGKALRSFGNVSKQKVPPKKPVMAEQPINLPSGRLITDSDIPLLQGPEFQDVGQALDDIIVAPKMIGTGTGQNLDEVFKIEKAIQDAANQSRLITGSEPQSFGDIIIAPASSGRKVSQELLDEVAKRKQSLEFKKLFGDRYIDLAEKEKSIKFNKRKK